MRRSLALVSSLLLVATFATPAQSAGAKYSVYQKTLAAFSSRAGWFPLGFFTFFTK